MADEGAGPGIGRAESFMMDGLGGGAREAGVPLPLFTVGLDYQAWREEGYSGASLCYPRWPATQNHLTSTP